MSKGKVEYKRRYSAKKRDMETVAMYFIDGVQVTKRKYDLVFPDRAGVPMMNGISVSCWPQRSKALAVHPKQVAQARARAKRHGLNVKYEPDGTAVLPTRQERAKLCAVEGFPDNSAGYSDYQGGNHKPPAEEDTLDIPVNVVRAAKGELPPVAALGDVA